MMFLPSKDQVKFASGILLIGHDRTADSPSFDDIDFLSDSSLMKAVKWKWENVNTIFANYWSFIGGILPAIQV